LIVALCLSLTGCASIDVGRSDIQDGSKLVVLSNLEERMFFNDYGITIFGKQEDAYIPLDNWGLAEKARRMVITLLQSDPKFEIVDNNNRGAQQFSEHIRWESTNFGKLGENTRRVQNYCIEENIDYLLLVQPGFATVYMAVLPANRGFGYNQKWAFGSRANTTVGYSSTVLLYDCVSGKEIQGLNEVAWHSKDVSESLEINEIDIHPEVEAKRAEHEEKYMAVIKNAVEKIQVFSLQK